MSRPNRFRGKWDVPYYKRLIRGARLDDLGELQVAVLDEAARFRPRNGLIAALRAKIAELEGGRS